MDKVNETLRNLYLVSGLNMSVYDIEGNLITSYPKVNAPFCALIKTHPVLSQRCLACDHQAFSRVKKSGMMDLYRCHFYLYDACMPIYTYGIHSGYLMMGQVLTDSHFDRQIIRDKALPYGFDPQSLDEAIQQIRCHSREQIYAFADIIDIIGQYFSLTHRLEAKKNNLAVQTMQYLITHFDQPITIDGLCTYFCCSKATLISHFKAEYHQTVHQYLLNYRLECAKEMLKSNMSIKEIALKCGFEDANYFSKAFKKKTGCSPAGYRQQFHE